MLICIVDDYDVMLIEEQYEWVVDFVGCMIFFVDVDLNYIMLFDCGVIWVYFLIQFVLVVVDRYVVEVVWDVNDFVGYGMQLVGLVLFGDLSMVLQIILLIIIGYWLELVKIMLDVGYNFYYLFGIVICKGIDVVEVIVVWWWIFCLVSIIEDDILYDGVLMFWLSEID